MPSSFLGIKGAPGTVVRDQVEVGRLADCSPLRIPAVLFSGDRPGPTVYVQAGLHGDEVTGIQLAMNLIESLDVADVRGTVVFVPMANPAAFVTRSRGYTLEERGPFDLNRIFPGSPTGVLSERLAHVLFSEFVLPADLTIDLHSALAGCDIYPFVYLDPDDDESGTLELRRRLAWAVGADFVYRKKRGSKLGTSVMTGSIGTQADLHGKPLMSVEMGESGRVSWHRMEQGVTGLLNLLREFGSVTGEPKSMPEPTTFSEISLVHAPTGGMHECLVDLGQPVKAGDDVAVVRDPATSDRTVVRAHKDGTVLRLMKVTPVATGAELVWIVA